MPQQGANKLPIWPLGHVGCISHSRNLAAAVVASRNDYRSIGIDLEYHLRDDECTTELIRSIQEPVEEERLTSLHALTRGEALTLIFSVKESVFKALYPLVHTFFDFKDVELTQCDASGYASLRLLRNLNVEWYAGRELDANFYIGDDYLLTWVAINA